MIFEWKSEFVAISTQAERRRLGTRVGTPKLIVVYVDQPLACMGSEGYGIYLVCISGCLVFCHSTQQSSYVAMPELHLFDLKQAIFIDYSLKVQVKKRIPRLDSASICTVDGGFRSYNRGHNVYYNIPRAFLVHQEFALQCFFVFIALITHCETRDCIYCWVFWK